MHPTSLGSALVALLLAPVLAGCTADDAGSFDPREREDAETFTLAPGGSVEYKLYLEEGARMKYAWDAGRPVFFDFHGDREGDASGAFTSHKKSALASDSDTFTAPFTGRHGWYWENRNRAEVTITLTTDGTYDVVGVTS